MFRQQFTKLDAFGIQDCGLTGDSCGQPLFSHKPNYWFKSEFLAPSFQFSVSRTISMLQRHPVHSGYSIQRHRASSIGSISGVYGAHSANLFCWQCCQQWQAEIRYVAAS